MSWQDYGKVGPNPRRHRAISAFLEIPEVVFGCGHVHVAPACGGMLRGPVAEVLAREAALKEAVCPDCTRKMLKVSRCVAPSDGRGKR